MSGGGGKGDSGSSFSGKDARQLLAEQGRQSRISQTTPGGSLVYGTTDANGVFKQDPNAITSQIKETPFQQQYRSGLEGSANSLYGQIAPQAGNLQQLNFSGLPQGASAIDWSKVDPMAHADQFGAQNKQAQEAVFGRAMQQLQPQLDLQQRRMEQRLADQGLPVGSEAYEKDVGNWRSSVGTQLNDLALGSVGAGNDEAARLYQQSLQGRQAQIGDQTLGIDVANQARNQGIGEQTSLRNQQMGELAGLFGGQYNPNTAPNFWAPTGVDASQGVQMQQQSRMANQQQQNSLWGGLAGLGGTLGSAYMMSPFMCWVAREVYGNANPKWLLFREWLTTKAPKWLLNLYLRKGAMFALWLHRRPAFKPIVRFLMDRVI